MSGMGSLNRILDWRAHQRHLAHTVERLCTTTTSGSVTKKAFALIHFSLLLVLQWTTRVLAMSLRAQTAAARRCRGYVTPTMTAVTWATSSHVHRIAACPPSSPVNHRRAPASHRGSAVTTSMTAATAPTNSTAVSSHITRFSCITFVWYHIFIYS